MTTDTALPPAQEIEALETNLTEEEQIVVAAFRLRYGEDGAGEALALLALLSSLNIELRRRGSHRD